MYGKLIYRPIFKRISFSPKIERRVFSNFVDSKIEFTLKEYLDKMEKSISDMHLASEQRLYNSQLATENRLTDNQRDVKNELLTLQSKSRQFLHSEILSEVHQIEKNTEEGYMNKIQETKDELLLKLNNEQSTLNQSIHELRTDLLQLNRDLENKFKDRNTELKEEFFESLGSAETRMNSESLKQTNEAQKYIERKFQNSLHEFRKELSDAQRSLEDRLFKSQSDLETHLRAAQESLEERLLKTQEEWQSELFEAQKKLESRLDITQTEFIKNTSQEIKVAKQKSQQQQMDLRKELTEMVHSAEIRNSENISKNIASNNFALVSTILAGISGLFFLFDLFGGEIISPFRKRMAKVPSE